MANKKRANGDGAIFFNETKKKWVGQITLGYDENGKRKRKTVYGTTKSEVKQKLKQIEIQRAAIDKWNGVLPSTMSGDTAIPFLNIN